MNVKISWKTFKQYRGPFIKGTVPFSLSDERKKYHVDRAFWLTTKVETGAKFGSVMAYDGTAMTAGLDQHVAVYPKELANEDFNPKDDQGSLWKLLRRLEYVGNDGKLDAAIKRLWNVFEKEGWYLAQDGVLRYLNDLPKHHNAGDIVWGAEIRDTLTPIMGKVSDHGKVIAGPWIMLFHDVFSAPEGFQTQIEFGKGHLVERTRKWGAGWPYQGKEITVLKVSELEEKAYRTGKQAVVNWSDNIGLELDLAMCMYHSNSVNAPGKAIQILKRCKLKDGSLNPRKLIKLLGTSSYGRWMDTIPGGRYQRTRSAARLSGLWPRRMFDGSNAIMPKNF